MGDVYRETRTIFCGEQNNRRTAEEGSILLTVIGSKAYGLLRNLLSPAKPAEKEFDEIVQVMQNHLNPRPLIIAERFKFHRRNQG